MDDSRPPPYTGGKEPPRLMQDENSGKDGRRYNEWFASRPDARLRAREAAAAQCGAAIRERGER